MSKDRSLGDFVGESASESASTEATDEEPEPRPQEAEPETPDTDAVEPATPTYRFDPDSATCDECGEAVQKRWQDDGQFVCADCKDW